MRTREELAWAAGFFDGEGCVGFYLQKGRRRFPHGQLMVRVMQIDRQVLDRFHEALGGVGKVYGPYEVKNKRYPNREPQWNFAVHSLEGCQAVMAMLWPWLSSVKREQTRKAMLAWRADRAEMLAAGRRIVS